MKVALNKRSKKIMLNKVGMDR